MKNILNINLPIFAGFANNLRVLSPERKTNSIKKKNDEIKLKLLNNRSKSLVNINPSFSKRGYG